MLEQLIIESTYKELATIKGTRAVLKEWKETVLEEITIATDIKCGISQKSSSFNTSQNELENNIKYPVKMFCSPDVEIKAGDEVIITFENGTTRTYNAGEPLYYISHLETPLQREVKA